LRQKILGLSSRAEREICFFRHIAAETVAYDQGMDLRNFHRHNIPGDPNLERTTNLTMGILYLVRHAQASFLEPNYDKLSALGETQSRLLGEHWAQRKIIFDRVCVGPCARQKDSAQLVSAAYDKAGLNFPKPQILPEFDEYHAEAVLRGMLPALLEKDQTIRDLHTAFQSAANTSAQRATFQKLFEAVIGDWVRGVIHLEGVETWPEFCARVNSGLVTFLASIKHGARVAIFTSGGPIAVATQRALHLSPESTLQMTWMSRNSSWSEFLYDAKRFTLSSFNIHEHISDPTMLTYR
jgi:broad specificity phosphatase PhoE